MNETIIMKAYIGLLTLVVANNANAFQSSLFTISPQTAVTRIHHIQPSTLHVTSTSVNKNSDIVPSPLSSNKKEDEFDWYSNWYPIVPIEFLDPSKPHKFTLLGMDLVVWNDSAESDVYESKKELNKSKKKKQRLSKFKNLFRKNKDDSHEDTTTLFRQGQWRVFADKCPHRLVPLSEGRIESDGSLLCSYHGWRFNGDGNCIDLPQMNSKEELQNIQSNPKSQCNSFPVKVVNDILWVWPTSGSDARIQSELTPLSVNQIMNDENGNSIPKENIVYNTYNFRELPYGADYFLENVVDPAHVPVSHHNIVGNRYTGPTSLTMKTSESMTKDGFVLKVVNGNSNGDSYTNLGFKSPCLVSIDAKVTPEGARQILELYVSPSRPGFCNHVGRLVMIKDKNGVLPSGFKQFTLPIPIWINHLLAAKFLNQDALFLHAQERNLLRDLNYKTSSSNDDDNNEKEKKDSPLYKEIVFTPTESDKGVLIFRDWLRFKAGGKIPFTNYEGMPPVNNEVVFDQWHSHTSKCKYCLDAHNNAKKVRLNSAMLAILIGVIRPRGVMTTLLSVGLLGGISFASHKLIGAFHRQEFSHAEND